MHRALKKCITCTMELGRVLVSPPQMERGSAFFGLARTSMGCVLRLLAVHASPPSVGRSLWPTKTGAPRGGDCASFATPPSIGWSFVAYKDRCISWGDCPPLLALGGVCVVVPGDAIHEAMLIQHQVKVEIESYFVMK